MKRRDVERLVAVEKDIQAAGAALKLNAEANNKHFTSLNGEAARLQQMQTTYLPREVWESALKSIIVTLVGIVLSIVFLAINIVFNH